MILELHNIFKTYLQGRMDVPVLKNVSLSVSEGEYVAIMGPSGSGKTTLMNIIGCLDNPTSGEYLLEGEDLSQQSDTKLSEVRLRSIGFVFQSFYLLPRQSAVENVALPLLYAGVKKAERIETARKALERVGLGDRIEFKPTQLSGGQCQRVAIARAIVNNPKILLADEPTGSLDTVSGEQVLEIFQKLNDEGVTIVMITHEQSIADHARRILHIRDGRLTDEQGNFLFPETVEQKPGLEPKFQKETLQESPVPDDKLLTELLPNENDTAADPTNQTASEQSVKEKAIDESVEQGSLPVAELVEKETQEETTVTKESQKPEREVISIEVDLAAALAQEMPIEDIPVELPEEPEAPAEESAEPEPVPEDKPVEKAPDEDGAPELVARPTKAGAPDQISFDIWQKPEEVPFDTAFDAVDPYEPAPEPGAFNSPLKLDVDLAQAMEPGVREDEAPTKPEQQEPKGDFRKPIKVDLDSLNPEDGPQE